MKAESQWQGWNDFLRYNADNVGLAPIETEAFVKGFIRENVKKKRSEIATQMPNNSTEWAYIQTMRRVYDKFKIEGTIKDKRKRFLKQLENEYFQSKFASHSFNNKDVEITHVIDKLRDRCIELFNQEKLLTTNSLIAKQGMTFKIDDLFVPLGLVERQKPSEDKPTEVKTQRFDHQQQFFDQVILHSDTPNSKGRRIAIIGEAGAGKTTLLQKIGDQLIHNNYIPIWISLKRLGNQTLDQYLIEDWLRNAAQVLDTVPEEWKTALEELLKTQQVFLLLDGVDEMTTISPPLQSIGEQINQCKIFDSARVILTCRSNLWKDYALLGFDAYQNLYFDYPTQVERFIDQFFQNSIKNKDLGETLKIELRLENKSRIRDLVKNPLRLFLLCYAWILGDGKLPDTQAELYKVFVENFYKVYQLKGSNFTIPVPKRKQLEKGLGELSKKALDDKKFLLSESVIEQYLGHPDDKDSLFYLGKKLNLLNCVGKCAENPFEDAYAFLHSTFQEYFAALAVDDWSKEFLNHVPYDPKLGIYRIFEPQWKQVILFWLGRDDVAKEAFIQKLVNFNDGCGEWSYENVDRGFYEYRAYFLAAAGINEFKQCSLSDKIVEQIVKWGFGYFNIEKQEWITFLDPIEKSAKIVLPETIRKSTIANLIQVLETAKDKYTRIWVAESLGEIAVGNESAIRELIRVLETTDDKNTRSSVANTLEKIAVGNELAIQALIQVLETTDDKNTRSSVANTLGKIAVGNELAIQVLSRVLETTEDTYIRSRIAESLGKIAVGNELAIWALRRILETTEDTYIRSRIAESLGKIDPGNELAIQALIQILETTKNKYTRMRVACSLEQIRPKKKLEIQVLIQASKITEDQDNRRILTNTLEYIQSLEKLEVRDLIHTIETTKNKNTRDLFAVALGKIAVGNELVIQALIRILERAESEDAHITVVQILGEIAVGNEFAIQGLSRVLKTTEDEETGWWVAESLRKIIKTEKQYTDVVFALNHNLTDEVYENDFDLFYYCFKLLWQCAQNLTYPEFYQAWHESDTTKEQLETSYNDLTEILKQLQPNDKKSPLKIDDQFNVQVILIDNSNFIDPDNPALDIYVQMVKQNCPKCSESRPKTMQELNTYWQLDVNIEDKPLFLLFYQKSNNGEFQGWSDRFLQDLDKFGGNIGIIVSEPINSLNLRSFFADDPQLIENILGWMRSIILEQ